MRTRKHQIERDSGQIVTNVRDGILEIRISNITRHNALSMRMWEDLAQAVIQADQDTSLRVVVLTGDGTRAFASGADISEFGNFRSDEAVVKRFNAAILGATRALAACMHPTVALIKGLCIGGGMSIAQSCDVRYCSEDARFRMPAGRIGIGYEPESVRRLIAVVGFARAADLFFTARTFFGREAEQIGYVQECFSTDEFVEQSAKYISMISRMAPLTLRAFKLALRSTISGQMDLPDASVVQGAFLNCFRSVDYQEGQTSFSEKREPIFKGR